MTNHQIPMINEVLYDWQFSTHRITKSPDKRLSSIEHPTKPLRCK